MCICYSTWKWRVGKRIYYLVGFWSNYPLALPKHGLFWKTGLQSPLHLSCAGSNSSTRPLGAFPLSQDGGGCEGAFVLWKTFISELLSSWSRSLEPGSELGAEVFCLCLSLNLKVRLGRNGDSFSASCRTPETCIGNGAGPLDSLGPRGTAEPSSPSQAPHSSVSPGPPPPPRLLWRLSVAFRKPAHILYFPSKRLSSALGSSYASLKPILSCLFMPTFGSISFWSYPSLFCRIPLSIMKLKLRSPTGLLQTKKKSLDG